MHVFRHNSLLYFAQLHLFFKDTKMKDNAKWVKGDYTITTDKNMLDLNFIHSFLTKTRWGKDDNFETVCNSIKNSFCFGLYKNNKQIGFTRYITDFTTIAYASDVFICDEHQGKGLGRWMMECTLEHPLLKNVRRTILMTNTAPWLYEKVGFLPINKENMVWHIYRGSDE